MSEHAEEVARGQRFEFGKNWKSFSETIDEDRVEISKSAIQVLLGADRLDGLTFLDVGSGSGLSSLAAHRLGATVVSFDYDPDSVACTRALRDQEGVSDGEWRIVAGSALDADFLNSLGSFDVVYSWGVLHHTGDMWRAIELSAALVSPGGQYALALYNDQGIRSRVWTAVKRGYQRMPRALKPAYAAATYMPREALFAMSEMAAGRPLGVVRSWRDYRRNRGMSRWHDIVDWVGGYPFEVSSPHEVFRRVSNLGFSLEYLRTVSGGLGCNEFTFRRTS